MTACVNRKHTKRVAAVVTASLVGALSMGAAPVAAVADTGIETLADDNADFARGTVDWRNGEPGDEFAYTGYYTGLVPKTITTVSGQEYDLELSDTHTDPSEDPSDHAYYEYVKVDGVTPYTTPNRKTVKYRDADGNSVDLKGERVEDGDGNATRPSEPGTYAVVIYTNGNRQDFDATLAESFTIANPDFSDALIYDGDDQTDTEFSYTGADNSAKVQNWIDRINVSVNGEKLEKGKDYTLQIWEKGGAAALDPDTVTLETGTTYIVKVIGDGRFDDEEAEKEFTFGKLDLSDAVVEGCIVLDAPGVDKPNKDLPVEDAVKSINGIGWDDLSNEARTHLELEFVSDPDGNQTFNGEKGVYTYKVTGSGDYLTGSATVKVVFADSEATVNMRGCTTKWESDANGDPYALVDLSRNTEYFDLSKIAFEMAGAPIELDKDEYAVTVVKQDGSAATVADLKVPGTYYVKVDVWAKNADGTYTAGSQVEKVVVSYATIDPDLDIFFSYDGENVETSASDVYSGKDFMGDMSVSVVVDNGTLVEGTDYTVTYEKVNDDDSRTAVDSIVDAGEYVVTVKGVTFDNAPGTEFYFDVEKATPEILVNWDLVEDAEDNTGYFSYTGEAIVPTFTFVGVDGNPIELAEGDFSVTYDQLESAPVLDYNNKYVYDVIEDDVEVKDVAWYAAKIKLSEDVANYAYDATARHHADPEILIEVSDKGIFLDVPMTGEWYSQSVYDAVRLGYMNGYSGTKVFGAGRTITRGEVACVLFNMAGGNLFYGDEMFDYNELFGYETGFSDVDGNEFYAKPIAWAKAAGVVNGYGDGTFAPDAPITAEEFCAMLANYAEALGDDVDGVDQAVLDSVSDADQVSGWAKQSVAWAVENEVMGNGGFIAPQESIKRERVAAMAVNYQPEKLGDVIINVNPVQ